MTPSENATINSVLDALVRNERAHVVAAASRIVLDAASREPDEGVRQKLEALVVAISALTPAYEIPSPSKSSSKGTPSDALPPETEPTPARPRVRRVGKRSDDSQ